jgi:drug/metabolite transporter (DMT)-like permease
MIPVLLGLVAALAWGLHDVIVRFISQKTNIFTALFSVLCLGAVFQFTVALLGGDLAPVPFSAWRGIVISGVFYTIAGISLYKAFEIGPVRLVSPLIATFSVLAVLWGVAKGQPFSPWQWGAVLAVLAGISIVATLSDKDSEISDATDRNLAIFWSLLASVSFTISFEMGQTNMHLAPEILIVFVTRLVAIAAMIPVMILVGAHFLPSRAQLPILAGMGMMDALAVACVLSAGSLPNANYATVASSAFGMVTVILAWAFLREKMTLPQWGGVILAFAGIVYLAI